MGREGQRNVEKVRENMTKTEGGVKGETKENDKIMG